MPGAVERAAENLKSERWAYGYCLLEGTLTGIGMQEAKLVMRAMQELNRRECNGHVKLRLGNVLAAPETFRQMFDRFSKGTYFEGIHLEIEEVPTVISCRCGYRRRLGREGYLPQVECPRCRNRLSVEQGDEFEIVEPQ